MEFAVTQTYGVQEPTLSTYKATEVPLGAPKRYSEVVTSIQILPEEAEAVSIPISLHACESMNQLHPFKTWDMSEDVSREYSRIFQYGKEKSYRNQMCWTSVIDGMREKTLENSPFSLGYLNIY